MKKKLIITLSAVACAIVLGVGIYQSDASHSKPNLSDDQIRQMVKDQYPGTVTEIELEKEYNQLVYEVEIEDQGKEYELKLDANTGEVLKLDEKEVPKKEQLVLTDDDEKEEPTKEQKNNLEKEQRDESKENTDNENNNQTNQTIIDANEAMNIALNEFSGIVTELELDEDDGRLMYEIEVRSGHEEAELDIDAFSGEILVIEIETNKDHKYKVQNNQTMIDAHQAISIALDKFSGTVTDLELDKDDGYLMYEIEIKSGHEEAEIEIDAYTGEVLSFEIDD